MNKIFTKPILTGAIVVALSGFNVAVFAQGGTTMPEIEALKFVVFVIGGITLLVITFLNVWAAIKNKDRAQLERTIAVQERLLATQAKVVADLEKEKAEEIAAKLDAERELGRKKRELSDAEEEKARMRAQLQLKGENNQNDA